MINGFHVDVSASEMTEHLTKRATHHRERAAWYEQEKSKIGDVITGHATNDPVAAMKEAGKRHGQKAEWFAFMAAHVPAGETFRLSDHDLERLEMISAKGY